MMMVCSIALFACGTTRSKRIHPDAKYPTLKTSATPVYSYTAIPDSLLTSSQLHPPASVHRLSNDHRNSRLEYAGISLGYQRVQDWEIQNSVSATTHTIAKDVRSKPYSDSDNSCYSHDSNSTSDDDGRHIHHHPNTFRMYSIAKTAVETINSKC